MRGNEEEEEEEEETTMDLFVEVVPAPTQYLPQDRVHRLDRPLSFTQVLVLLHPQAQT